MKTYFSDLCQTCRHCSSSDWQPRKSPPCFSLAPLLAICANLSHIGCSSVSRKRHSCFRWLDGRLHAPPAAALGIVYGTCRPLHLLQRHWDAPEYKSEISHNPAMSRVGVPLEPHTLLAWKTHTLESEPYWSLTKAHLNLWWRNLSFSFLRSFTATAISAKSITAPQIGTAIVAALNQTSEFEYK